MHLNDPLKNTPPKSLNFQLIILFPHVFKLIFIHTHTHEEEASADGLNSCTWNQLLRHKWKYSDWYKNKKNSPEMLENKTKMLLQAHSGFPSSVVLKQQDRYKNIGKHQ